MESTITGAVGEVTGRTVNTSRGQAPIFDVLIGSQKVSTFKAPIAEEAKALQGSTVEATVDVTQKGDYTNYTLLGVKLVNAGGSTPTSAPSTIAVAPPENATEKQQSIVRQCCIKAAGHALSAGSSPNEVLEIAEQFYQWCQNGPQNGAQELVGASAGATEKDDGVPW